MIDKRQALRILLSIAVITAYKVALPLWAAIMVIFWDFSWPSWPEALRLCVVSLGCALFWHLTGWFEHNRVAGMTKPTEFEWPNDQLEAPYQAIGNAEAGE